MQYAIGKYDRLPLIGVRTKEIDSTTIDKVLGSMSVALGQRAFKVADCARSPSDLVWLFRRLEELSAQLEDKKFHNHTIADAERWSLERSYEGTVLACALALGELETPDFGWEQLGADFAPLAERLWIICTHWAHFSDLYWGARFLQVHTQFSAPFQIKSASEEVELLDLSELAVRLFPRFPESHRGELDGLANHDPSVSIGDFIQAGGREVLGFDPVLITARSETLETLLGSVVSGAKLLVVDPPRFEKLFFTEPVEAERRFDFSTEIRTAIAKCRRNFSELRSEALEVVNRPDPAMKVYPVFPSCMLGVSYSQKPRFLLLPRFGHHETISFSYEFGSSDSLFPAKSAAHGQRRGYKDHIEKIGLPKAQLQKLFDQEVGIGQLARSGKFLFGYNVTQICGHSIGAKDEDLDVVVIDTVARRIRFAECKFRYAEMAFRNFRKDLNIVVGARPQISKREDWLRQKLGDFEFAGGTNGEDWDIHGGVLTNQFPVGLFHANANRTPDVAVLGSERARSFFLDGKAMD